MDGNGDPDDSDPNNERGILGVRAMSQPYNMRLMETALRNGYPIGDDLRNRIVENMDNVLTNAADPRLKINAARVLLAADKLNVQREHGPRHGDQHLHIHTDGPSEKPATVNELRERLAERRRLRLAAQQEQGGADSVAFEGNDTGADVANSAQALPQIIDTTCTNTTV